jgi:hypothetical protein
MIRQSVFYGVPPPDTAGAVELSEPRPRGDLRAGFKKGKAIMESNRASATPGRVRQPFNPKTFLEKAKWDPWRYAVRLRTGELFICETIVPVGEGFVRLEELDEECLPKDYAIHFGRGIEVREREIVWIADGDS